MKEKYKPDENMKIVIFDNFFLNGIFHLFTEQNLQNFEHL